MKKIPIVLTSIFITFSFVSCLSLENTPNSNIDLDKVTSLIEKQDFQVPEPDGDTTNIISDKYVAKAEPISKENEAFIEEKINLENDVNQTEEVSIVPKTEEKLKELSNNSLFVGDDSNPGEIFLDENGSFAVQKWESGKEVSFDIIPSEFVSADQLLPSSSDKPIDDATPDSTFQEFKEETNLVSEEEKKTEEPKIIWEDENENVNSLNNTDTLLSISSGPVYDDKPRDILDEYNQFLLELGDDYKQAKSVDNEEFESYNTLAVDSNSENTATSESFEEEWKEIPTTEEKDDVVNNKEEKKGFFSTIASFFSNLWHNFVDLLKSFLKRIKELFTH